MNAAAKRLRSGFTTGACAAAAAKAAAMMAAGQPEPREVEIPFPDGSRHRFAIHRTERRPEAGKLGSDTNFPGGHLLNASFTAAVIKDAGDDPDVTNGAEVEATVAVISAPKMELTEAAAGDCLFMGGWDQLLGDGRPLAHDSRSDHSSAGGAALATDSAMTGLWLGRGTGVGVVSKPGLAIAPGQPAINPVPRRMIAAALAEVWPGRVPPSLLVTISVPDGERLALKTLNRRLGIIGGLSILGTTGIVRPVSAEAWTATIVASLDVARAAGLPAVLLSTGRTSEKGVQQLLELPEEACAMMGDYLQFSLREAGKRGFSRIHLAGMWAKIVKAALQVPQTHVRNGALEVRQATALLAELGAEAELVGSLADANTAREIYLRLQEQGRQELIEAVCRRAAEYAAATAGVPVTLYLVESHAKVVMIVSEGGGR